MLDEIISEVTNTVPNVKIVYTKTKPVDYQTEEALQRIRNQGNQVCQHDYYENKCFFYTMHLYELPFGKNKCNYSIRRH